MKPSKTMVLENFVIQRFLGNTFRNHPWTLRHFFRSKSRYSPRQHAVKSHRWWCIPSHTRLTAFAPRSDQAPTFLRIEGWLNHLRKKNYIFSTGETSTINFGNDEGFFYIFFQDQKNYKVTVSWKTSTRTKKNIAALMFRKNHRSLPSGVVTPKYWEDRKSHMTSERYHQ